MAQLCPCILTEYEIAITTANTDDASTTENAWIVLEGRKARSKEFVLENKKKKFLWYVFKETICGPCSWYNSYMASHNLSLVLFFYLLS